MGEGLVEEVGEEEGEEEGERRREEKLRANNDHNDSYQQSVGRDKTGNSNIASQTRPLIAPRQRSTLD